MPEIQNTRVDLLGETAAGELIHIELQSTNDPEMTVRMVEYCSCAGFRKAARKVSARF